MINLNTEIAKINRIGQMAAKRLKNLDILTVNDLLFYFPYRYDDFSKTSLIKNLQPNQNASIVGQIELIQNKRSFRKRMFITEALVSDSTGQIKVIWFNQPFIAKTLKVGNLVSLAGKVENDYGNLTFASPVYERITSRSGDHLVHTQGLVPIYHLTANLTQKQIRFLIKETINIAREINDWLPTTVIKNQKLITLPEAIYKIHFPKDWQDVEIARTRLAFNELFLMQLRSQLIKQAGERLKAQRIVFQEAETKKFVSSLPYRLTNDQRQAAWEILKDLDANKPMSRLLEGDVGSGKTIVAALAMLNVFLNGRQSVLMAPTEILAMQHYDTLCNLFKNQKIKIGLLTRSNRTMNYEAGIMNDARKKIKSTFITQKFNIIIGTHALIQEDIKFNNLALAIIDEQHRFGVDQRAKLSTRTNTDSIQTDADFTQTNTDLKQTGVDKEAKKSSEENHDLLYKDITYKIRGAAFKIKKQLGLGHKEIIYQKAFEQELINVGLKFEKEKSLDVYYENKKIGVYRPDFLIEGKIILELKKLPFIDKVEKKQIWDYLKNSEYSLALLINFASSDVQIERFINTCPHKSALSPHLLSMTATPIPRSLALALYGDLDLSIIKEMPTGRKQILTKVVLEEKRNSAYNFIREQIKTGRQAFVICPLIDESDKLGVKSVKEEYKKLNEQIFPELKIGILHGRLKAEEKKNIMEEFKNNEIKIVVATSVIEVGIDIPNATIMMVEGADRFGLAQLHQFRGRVGRSIYQSYCFLFSDSNSIKTKQRLSALEKYNDGFALAKIDLKFRGPGELYGLAQKGFPELKIASLFDYDLIKKSYAEVEKLIAADISQYPELMAKIKENSADVHLE